MKSLIAALKKDKELARKFYCLVICVFSIVAITLAWFFNGKATSTDGFDFTSIEAINLEVSLDGTNYYNDLTIPYPDNLEFEPVSGDGKTNEMYIAELPVDSNDATQATNWEKITYDANAEKNSFYALTLYFRSDNPGYVVLSDVAVDPKADPDDRQDSDYTDKSGGSITVSDTVDRPIKSSIRYSLISTNAIFTKDYIAGAARIGLVNKTNDNTSTALQNALIIPNDTYKLTTTITGNQCDCTFQENAASVSDGYFYNGTTLELYSAGNVNPYTETNIKGGTCPTILEMVPNGDGRYTGCIDVYIWIEGNDSEAHELLSDGQILTCLTFSLQTITA